MKINIIEVNQPIGSFYLASLDAQFIINNFEINRRDKGNNGIQRKLNSRRVKEISHYTNDPDATFPTPIIINIDTKITKIELYDNYIEIDETSFKAELLDGQHRIYGLKESSNINKFQLPVVLLFDLTEEEKAYIFSTINGNQVKVDKSLIYELFSLSDKRSPYKTAHEIARALNSDEDSPLQYKLKMLGRKTSGNETLSQGAFVNSLVELISKDPQKDLVDEKRNKHLYDNEKLVFRYYYINNNDAFIYKVLKNYFSAFRDVFREEWNDSNKFMLAKTTGFGGMMLALRKIAERGLFQNDLSYDFFLLIAKNLHNELKEHGIELSNKEFPSNIQQQRRFEKYIINSIPVQ